MAFCTKCGAQVEEGKRYCTSCGNDLGGASFSQKKFADDVTEKFNKFNNTSDSTYEYGQADIQNNKGMAILSYFSWLVLIPIFAEKNSKFVRFHANQGLVLAIASLLWTVVNGILNKVLYAVLGNTAWAVYSILTSILGLVGFVFVILAVIGIINAAQGKAKELPVIGSFSILK